MSKLTYCPICNEIKYHDRDKVYHCPGCGHHLNTTDVTGDDIMSNEYKEWEEDRKLQAWEDILRIADFIEICKEEGANDANKILTFIDIVKLLEEGDWI